MKKIILITLSVTLFAIAGLANAETISKQNDRPFPLEEATIKSINTALEKHQITCEQLVNAYIDRIKKYNLSINNKPPINAIARINPNVLEQARKLDEVMGKNPLMSSLHCIPVLLKDNIDSYDSETTSGSIAMLGNQPLNDAFLVEKLRNAGAIILGKGTMDEFASGISGISGGNGRTGNVYDTSENSGGSSSGPATAVSANFVTIGIGTDNSGSIRIPAAFNGIFGLRPSTGLISQRGIFPRGNMDGIAGPLSRSVEDLATILDVIAQPDPQDKKTLGITRPKTYTAYLNLNGLQGKRIGIIRKVEKFDTFKNMHKDTSAELQNSLNEMEKMGATIIDDINLENFDLNRKFNQAREIEDINKYLASYPAVRKNYLDICESNRTRVFGSVKNCLQKPGQQDDEQYDKALNIFKKNKLYIESVMDKHNLDALLIPVSATGGVTYESIAVVNESVSSNAGLPGITINAGYTNKIPIGVELIGRQFAEGTLIEMAYAYEKHTQPRMLPPMPEKNAMLEMLEIPEYNNLLTNIGYDTYEKILSKSTPEKFSEVLTPEVFRSIVSEALTENNGFPPSRE